MGLFNIFNNKSKEQNKVETNIKEEKKEMSNEEKEELIKLLPKFKYHPNLYNNDIVTFKKGICNCCGKEVNAYLGMMYSKEKVDCICLNCVSDGSAAEKFDGTFIQEAEQINNPLATEELEKRTPGYVSWQGEHWLACCNDYCEFIGDVGTKELNEMGIAEEVFDEYAKKFSHKDIKWVKENLKASGTVAGYLFKCRHCGKYHLYVDLS